MYILILVFITNAGYVSSSTAEFTSYNACVAAKTSIEQQLPAQLSYSNVRSLTCQAK